MKNNEGKSSEAKELVNSCNKWYNSKFFSYLGQGLGWALLLFGIGGCNYLCNH
jgi:hypothetical protein